MSERRVEGPGKSILRHWTARFWVNLLGVAIVAGYLIGQFVPGYVPPWVFVCGLVALAAWLLRELVPDMPRALPRALIVILVVAAAVTAAPSNGVMIAAAIVGLIAAGRNLTDPIWFGPALGIVAVGLVPVGALTVDMSPEGLISLEAGIVIGVLGGVTRRQTRANEQQTRELLERTAAMREEQALAGALAARQALARDMHDVLAHSLGALVIQLDAADALLDAGVDGNVDKAQTRVRDARGLAASGLAEARRAVDALRNPADDTAPEAEDDVTAVLHDLVDANTRLGAVIEFRELGTARPVAGALAMALRRALQESLSNARKHAAGAPVTVTLQWSADAVTLQVRNPFAGGTSPDAGAGTRVDAVSDLASSGGARGLVGMAERFEALPGGGFEAGADGAEFVVRVCAATSTADEAVEVKR